MRICIAHPGRHSNSETFIVDQIKGLSTLATVFTIQGGRLPERREDGTLLNPRLFWALHKIVKGVTGRRNNYFGNYGIKKFLLDNDVDVVLANYGLSGAHLIPICHDLNIPLIVIFHGHDVTDKKLLMQYTHKYKNLFAKAASLVAVSADMKEKIIGYGADPNKVMVVPCGVDLTKFRPSQAQKENLFLAVGRFVPKKGPLLTIEAFHEVWKKHPNVKLVMAGDRKGLYEECVKKVHSYGMQHAVSFPGNLKHEEVSKLMEKALAFVQHSMVAKNGDMEGTPVSVLEACASGLPVVSTLHGGIKDAIVHGKTGFLVEEGDVKSMAEYMTKIAEDPSAFAFMGKAARMHIEKHYNQVNQIRKLFDIAVNCISHRQ